MSWNKYKNKKINTRNARDMQQMWSDDSSTNRFACVCVREKRVHMSVNVREC